MTTPIRKYYISQDNKMSTSRLHAAIAIARALGHQARLRSVVMLRSGDLCVCQIAEVLKLAPSTVSLHLKELKRSGLISERKEGRWVYIALSEDPEARPWIDNALAAVAGDQQLEDDKRIVQELRRLPVEDLCRLGYEEARAKQAGAATAVRRSKGSDQRARPKRAVEKRANKTLRLRSGQASRRPRRDRGASPAGRV